MAALAMTDKLGALGHLGGRDSKYDLNENGDMELEDLNKVLMTADDLTRVITTIKKNIDRTKENHNTILTTFSNQGAKKSNETINEEIKKLSRQVHAQLKRMKTEVSEEEVGPNRNSAEFRIKKAQFSTLTRLFKEVMEDYNNEQEIYREKSKDLIQKKLQYIGQSVTEEKLESMLESDDPQIFSQNLITITAQKRIALGECEARHVEILALEQNIQELHDMFYDMALLVDEQGELIDLIERNVERAGVYVYHGHRDIKRARVAARTGRWTRWVICIILCGCCFCLLVIGAIVAGVIVYYQSR